MKVAFVLISIMLLASLVFGQEPIALMQGDSAPFSGVLVSESLMKTYLEQDATIDKINYTLKLSEARLDTLEEKYLNPLILDVEFNRWFFFIAGMAIGMVFSR